jgi:hypothetical protein
LHLLENSIAAKRIFEIAGKRVPPALENAISDSLPIEIENNLSYIAADINGVKGRFCWIRVLQFPLFSGTRQSFFTYRPSSR